MHRVGLALLPILAQLGAPSTTPAPSASAVGAKVQKMYDLVTTFEADFDQENKLHAFGTTKAAKGRVTLEKPGKMRWEYSAPHTNLLVSDGKTLWKYDSAAKTACKAAASPKVPSAFGFLVGKGDLTKDFSLSFAPIVMVGGHVLNATPKAANSAFTHLLLYVDASTFHVRRLSIVDPQTNTNAFTFSNTSVNAKVPATRFQYTPGPGVTITPC